jgi:hypothetical protein
VVAASAEEAAVMTASTARWRRLPLSGGVHRPLRRDEEVRRAEVDEHRREAAAQAAPYEASSLRRRSRSPTPPSAFNDDEDDADSGRVIGPEDFVKRPAEEELALAEALAKTATEEAERRAALRAVEVFQEREAARAQRLADRVAEAAHVLLPPPPLLGSRLRQSRSPAPPAIGGVDRPR